MKQKENTDKNTHGKTCLSIRIEITIKNHRGESQNCQKGKDRNTTCCESCCFHL